MFFIKKNFNDKNGIFSFREGAKVGPPESCKTAHARNDARNEDPAAALEAQGRRRLRAHTDSRSSAQRFRLSGRWSTHCRCPLAVLRSASGRKTTTPLPSLSPPSGPATRDENTERASAEKTHEGSRAFDSSPLVLFASRLRAERYPRTEIYPRCNASKPSATPRSVPRRANDHRVIARTLEV